MESKQIAPLVIFVVVLIAFINFILQEDDDAKYYSAKQRSNFFIACRENNAVVVDSSMFWAEGSAYIFKKDLNGKFNIAQRLDLSKYLNGNYVSFINEDDKGQFEKFSSRQPVAFNDSFLVVLTSKSTDPSKNGFYDGDVLVFKKIDGNFVYHDRIKHILPYVVAITSDNHLILSVRRNKFFSSKGSLLCYKLSDDGVEKVQTITPPEDIKNQFGRVIDSSKYNVRFGSYFHLGTGDDALLVECRANYRGVLDESMFDKIGSFVDANIYLIYKRINDKWVYSQSTSELLPCSFYENTQFYSSLSSIYDPLSYVTNVYLDKDTLQFSCVNIMHDEKHLIEFKRNKKSDLFEYYRSSLKEYIPASENGEKIEDTYDNTSRVDLVIQCRKAYSLCVMNKSTELGIAPPSFENNPEVLSPEWIIPSGNKKSMNLMVDYYKNNCVVEFVRKYGYDNFYDFTKYVPVLHYSICGDNLVVSYVFIDCFYNRCPLFYKLDLERGPIKMSSFTTSNLEPLKEAPVE